MTKLKQVYRCNICGNLISITATGKGQLVCCQQPMELLQAKTTDEGSEKHLPVITKNGRELTVTVGSTKHPMETAHYITWIEIMTTTRSYRQWLQPSDEPVVQFILPNDDRVTSVQAYCNVHGLWRTELKTA